MTDIPWDTVHTIQPVTWILLAVIWRQLQKNGCPRCEYRAARRRASEHPRRRKDDLPHGVSHGRQE